MRYSLPRSLSPSKVSVFKDCALAFRFSALDHLPQPRTVATVRGSLVHRALELVYSENAPGSRNAATAEAAVTVAVGDLRGDVESLGLDPVEASTLESDVRTLTRRCFELEDPDEVDVAGTELRLEAPIGGVTLRGVIDRLDVEPDGSLVVVDYKTGRAPQTTRESASLAGVHLYALLCEQALGIRPARLELYYLKDGLVITATPSDQALSALERRTSAIWSAIERACERDDFRPRPSALCGWCSFRQYCPAFGGDPNAARGAGSEVGSAAVAS
ncbi:MAG: PD-(D/E)XK nuclease family protein [Actinomycetota bacterium]|nr:PD-(D/E)XK nuclease family protein [Actinomycetota bacterium]